MKDSIDFGSMNISTLFRKLLIPTVLGMVFSALFVITDGIFVGKGIGSDALAAVNITAPLFMIAAGIGLMSEWELRWWLPFIYLRENAKWQVLISLRQLLFPHCSYLSCLLCVFIL